MSTFSPTTYTMGNAVTLSCLIDYGDGGTGPNSVSWSGKDSLTSDDYNEDLGTNPESGGIRTTTITFESTNAIKYASTYICNFVFDGDDTVYANEIELIVRCEFLTSTIKYGI